MADHPTPEQPPTPREFAFWEQRHRHGWGKQRPQGGCGGGACWVPFGNEEPQHAICEQFASHGFLLWSHMRPPARVAARATYTTFRMLGPMEGHEAYRVAKGRPARGGGAVAWPQAAKASEARGDATQQAIHVHYGIHVCEPYSCEIRMKFASIAY